MALFKPYKITNSQLSSLPIKEGQLVFVTDAKKLYFDTDADTRTLVSADSVTGFTVNGTTVNYTKADGSSDSFEIQITGAVTGVKGNSESSYRSGNVNITKANIGLGNVDNKSSETIRGELTKANVTGALGYTPAETDTNTTYTFATGSSNGTISVTPSGGSAQNVAVKGLAAAAYKAVDTSIVAGSTSANLPTAAAVASFVEGKGYITTDNNTTYTFGTGSSNGTIKVTPSDGDATDIAVKGLAAAAYKGVATSIAAGSTATTLPTAAAVASFVEGKGYKTTDNDTTYTLTQDATDGHKITLTPSSGTATTITIPDNNTTYIGENGVTVSGTKISNSGVRSIATGSANGTISVNTNGTSANVAVKGLGSLAYKSSLSASDVGAIASSLKGAKNGVAELDADGKVPSAQLPSYVDDVLEYDKFASFPTTGEAGKIYIAQDTNKTYRWSGSAYVEISASLALGTTSSTAYRGDYGNTAYTHATDANRLTTATASGFYKIAATAHGHVRSLTAVTKTDITNLGIPAQDTTYESKAAESGGTDVSLVTTGEKATWNAKSNLTIGTTSTTAAAGNHTHTASLATDTGTSAITLAHGGKYKLTAGGSSVIFTMPTDNNTNYYPTTFAWTNGTTSGPTGSLTGSGMSAVSFGAIPAANGTTRSGIVTTGAQTFGGVKTFSSAPKLSTNTITTSSGYTITIPNTANATLVTVAGSQALTNKTYNGYTLADASAKGVDTSISDGSTSTNLPTTAAVVAYVGTLTNVGWETVTSW